MTNSRRFTPPEGVLGSLSEFGGDLTTLVELQTQLAILDLKESVEKAKTPFLISGIFALVALAALPVLIIGLGFVIADYFQFRQGVALLMTAGVFLVVGGVVAAFAGLRFARSFESFRRSREELNRNLAWIRTVISQNVGS